MHKALSLCFTLMITATLGFAGGFKLENGSFAYHQASHDLAKDMRTLARQQKEPTYFAYQVDSLSNYRTTVDGDCRWSLKKGRYATHSYNGIHYDSSNTQSQTTFTLILAYQKGSLQRISMVNDYCSVDGGGATVHWFNQVTPAASIHLLATALLKKESLHEEALTAIALHDDPFATETLIDFSQATHAHGIRKSSMFWLGQTGSEPGLNRLVELVAEEENLDLRKHLTFIFSMHKSPKAKTILKDLALNDSSDEIRTSAFFWMAQSGHPEAESLILEQLEQDPSSHFVSQVGVMLSQLPDERGMVHLERLVTEGKRAEIRKQALFWLGQSKTASARETVLHTLENERDPDVQKHAVFVLGQFEDNASLDALIDLAQNHESRHIRGTAMFWLGQKASTKARGTLKEAVMHDGKEDVMEQALMGIAQIQDETKIPLLIEVATDHKSAKIRERAVFWISQSDDPQALSFIKSLLLDNR